MGDNHNLRVTVILTKEALATGRQPGSFRAAERVGFSPARGA